MTKRAWGAIGVLAALLIVMFVVAARELLSQGTNHKAAATASRTAPAPPPPRTRTYDQPSPGAVASATTQANTGSSVLSGAGIQAAHSVIVDYLQALGSYTYTDRQSSWQKAALAYTNRSVAIRAYTRLPSGRAWAQCKHEHCRSTSTANVIRDVSVTNVPGTGGAPQVVSYVDLATTISGQGTQHTRFTVSAARKGDDWKVIGIAFAGVGDAGANGEGP